MNLCFSLCSIIVCLPSGTTGPIVYSSDTFLQILVCLFGNLTIDWVDEHTGLERVNPALLHTIHEKVPVNALVRRVAISERKLVLSNTSQQFLQDS